MEKRISDLNLAFSTPIWTSLVSNYNEVNTKMMSYIQSLRSNNPKGKMKSNLLGWHSENFNLQDPEPQFFINSISKNINELMIDMNWDLKNNKTNITGMWSIINPKNASNSRHIHSNNFISAAYYVKANKDSGDIVFYDPRSANSIRTPKVNEPNKLNSNFFSITPKEGLLVLFPSYLNHSVDLNNSDEERVVISFNIDLI